MATTLSDFEIAYGVTLEEWLRIGGSSGDYMQKYWKWVEDPIAFHQTQPIPYFAVYEEAASKGQNSQALEVVNDEIERIDIQRENKNPSKPGYFKMGTVELTIPPIQISVSDIKHNMQYKTLRTKSDIIFQSGHSAKVIELDIYFHNIEEVDTKLRPLLAQLKCMPFIPIYSDYLSSVLDPDGPGDNLKYIDENGKEVNHTEKVIRIDSEIKMSKNKLREKIRKNAGLMAAKPTLISDLNSYWEQALPAINSSKLDAKKTLSENIDNVLVEAGIAENVGDPEGIRYQSRETQSETAELFSAKNDEYKEIKEIRDEGNLVGVLSQINVGTVAGFPESLACHATLFLFNYQPFSSKFEFLDKNNKPTTDVDECLYFIQWYASRFLAPKGKGNEVGKYYKPLERQMNGEVKISYEEDGHVIVPEISTNNDTVCASTTISQKNSIAFLPVLQWSVPTCQYLGAYNSEVILTFDTIDVKFLDNFRYLTDVVEEQSRTNIKKRRSNYITVKNELLALLGIERCAIQSIDTSTVEGSPGMYRIILKLTEFDVRQIKDIEQIVENNNITEEMYREFFRADIKSFINNDAGDLSTFSESELKSFRNSITNFDTYLEAVGHSEIIHGDISFSARQEVPGLVPFRDNKVQMNRLLSVLKDRGLQAGVSEGLIYVRVGNEGDAVPYSNEPWKRGTATYLKKKVEQRPDELKAYDLETLLWNSDDFREYRESRVRDRIQSYLYGESSALPENVREQFEKTGITKDRNKVIEIYPDMDLPTYTTTKRVGVGAQKPSYSRLGTRSPILRQNDSPRIDADTVEPDFCFRYEPLESRTFLMDDGTQKTLAETMRKAWNMVSEDFSKIVTEEIPNYVGDTSKHEFETELTTFPIDDLLDEGGTKSTDNTLKEEQQKARAAREKIQKKSQKPTTPEELSLYKKTTENKDTVYPEDQDWTTKRWYLTADGEFGEQTGNEDWVSIINSSWYYTIDPPGYSIYDRYTPNKRYSDTDDNYETDSGVNVYGGIIPDSSFNEEIRSNGQGVEG